MSEEKATTGTAAETAGAGDDKTETTQGTAEVALEAGSLPVPATIGRSGPEVTDVRTGMFGVQGSGDTSGFGGLVRTVTRPGPSAGPYGSWFDDALAVLAEVLGEAGVPFEAAVEGVVVHRGELTLEVAREHLLAVCRALRDDQDLRFELGLGVSGVHYPHEAGRELHAVYHLTSVTHGRRIRLEVAVPDGDPHIPSTTSVYPGHDWHERETYDFFGIVFDGHPALARIEMPDDWVGHPQRKDYPLGGVPVEYKGAHVAPADERRSYS